MTEEIIKLFNSLTRIEREEFLDWIKIYEAKRTLKELKKNKEKK